MLYNTSLHSDVLSHGGPRNKDTDETIEAIDHRNISFCKIFCQTIAMRNDIDKSTQCFDELII